MDYAITQSQKIHKDFVDQMTNEDCSKHLDGLDQDQQKEAFLTNHLVQAIIQESKYAHQESWSKEIWDKSF